jgi:cystathionine beta-lyase
VILTKYNFDEVIERRGTNSSKWDMNEIMFGKEDVLDLWVADMDFPCPEPVVRAIRERLEHPLFGYTFPSQGVYEAIVGRMQREFGWKIKKEWIVFNGGVVDGLYSTIQAFTHPGDEVVVQSPVYYPFFGAIKNSGAQVLNNPLKSISGSYYMDVEGLAELFVPRTTFPVRVPKVKAFILCSPHNPVGRVWKPHEIKAAADICVKNDCLILSDEIHAELLMKGHKHTVTATLSEEIEQLSFTYMAASKTFNLAGLGTSFVIIPNDKLRNIYIASRAGRNSGNMMGLIALEAAFRYGDPWLYQLRDYLQGNFDFLKSFIAEKLPQLKLTDLEGTYLAWIDMTGLNLPPLELQRFIRERARLALDDGYAFGPGGEGFQRINIACPRPILKEALERLREAVRET